MRVPTWSDRLPRMGIAQKIGALFVALLMIAAVNVMLMESMMDDADSVADTVNVAGKLRMIGQRVALQTISHGQGVGAGAAEVRQLMRDFESALAALADGGYVFGIYVSGLSSVHKTRLDGVREQWSVYRRSVHALLDELPHYRSALDASLAQGEGGAILASRSNEVRRLTEDMAGHSARLLERAEALMNGILMEVKSLQDDAMQRMYVLLAVDVLLILLAFVAVRRQIVIPLRDLSTHCRELAAGNYNTRFEVSTQDEIGQLAKVFNESAWRIGSLIDRIEQDRANLERADNMFRGIAENSMVGVYIAYKGRFRYVNAKMADMFGYTRSEMVEKVSSTIIFPETSSQKDDDAGARERLIGEVPGLWMERKGRRKDGTLIEVEVFGSLMMLDNELVTIGIALDITRRKEVEAQARLAMLVHRYSSEAMVVTDASGRLMSVNPAFTKITGYQPEEVIGKRLNLLSSGRHDADFYRQMWTSIQNTGSWEGDIWNRRKNGEIYAERLIINTSYDDDGMPRYRIGLFSDITKQKEADAFIWRQANYDHLTGLPNRQLFHDRLEKEMRRSDNTGRPMALVHLDLDDFKELNDTLGHGIGDKLLAEAGERLQSCVRSTDTVARLGGDEFVFILGGLSDLAAVDNICSLAMERLTEPYLLDGEHATISASMGITFYPLDGDSVKDLMQNADLAMYAAKARGKRQTVRFQPSMQVHVAMRRELAQDLTVAIQEQQFCLAYQPIVELATGRIDKVECLVRWQHPQKGLVPPSVFIPFAEDTGMIHEIGQWVFHEAVRQVAHWRTLSPTLQASINVSPVQFVNKIMRPREWLEYLEALGMAGEHVVVEITERLLMDADSEISSKLIAFRDAGVQMALDDFGTGYSSMSYLKRFDIDYIKIDQSFVRNLAEGSEDLVLCEAMIVMAHRLGLQVVAEGVETVAQRDLLLAAGCDFAQGYLYSRPVDAARFESLLRTGHIATAMSKPQSSNIG